jgi:hypothetical protein
LKLSVDGMHCLRTRAVWRGPFGVTTTYRNLSRWFLTPKTNIRVSQRMPAGPQKILVRFPAAKPEARQNSIWNVRKLLPIFQRPAPMPTLSPRLPRGPLGSRASIGEPPHRQDPGPRRRGAPRVGAAVSSVKARRKVRPG